MLTFYLEKPTSGGHSNLPGHFHTSPACLYPFTDVNPSGGGWSGLQLALVTVGPCLLLLFTMLVIVLMARGYPGPFRELHLWPCRTQMQDPEEALDEETLMSPDKCLKDLIYDMTTSGSGSGNSTTEQKRWKGVRSLSCVSEGGGSPLQASPCWCSGPLRGPSSCRSPSGKVAMARCGEGSGVGKTWP